MGHLFIFRLWSEPAQPLPRFLFPPAPRCALLGVTCGSMKPGTSATCGGLGAHQHGHVGGVPPLPHLMFGKHFHGGLGSALEGDWEVWTPRRGLGPRRLGMTLVRLVAFVSHD